MAVPQERLRVAERPGAAALLGEGLGVSWGGVWSGVLIAVGTMLLLATLGVAIGAGALSRGAGADARDVGGGAAIWAALTLLAAMFVGGMVATRLGVVIDRPTCALHGALVWVLAMLGVLYLAASGISLGVNGLFAGAGGDRAAAITRNTAWITFGAMVVSLAAAMAGAVWGGRQTAERVAARL